MSVTVNDLVVYHYEKQPSDFSYSTSVVSFFFAMKGNGNSVIPMRRIM